MTGNEVALDTNVAIEFINKTSKRQMWIDSIDRIYLPLNVLAELYWGAENSGKPDLNYYEISLLEQKSELLLPDRETALLYAQTRRQLKASGKPIPENDIWIAAICVQHTLKLATYDRHFEAVFELELFPIK